MIEPPLYNYDILRLNRNKALIEAVENDNFKPIEAFLKENDFSAPWDSVEEMKRVVYESVQLVQIIPTFVKDKAIEKLIQLGYSPESIYGNEGYHE